MATLPQDAPLDAQGQPIPAEYQVGAQELADLSAKLVELLKIRTFPIGMKRFRSQAEFESVRGLRRPKEGRFHTTCQLVTQARIAGFTIGIGPENVRPAGNCGGVLGIDVPDHGTISGEHMDGVWFENREAARCHQETMPRAPYDDGAWVGTVVSPLRAGRLDPPDIVLFYATPGQMILFVNGLQWKRYRRYDMTITGESACADSWGRALLTNDTSISVPCFAERRYGGVADDEMLIAMPPHEFARGVEGLQGLSKVGLRYPIMPFGPQADPSEGMAKSYG